MDKTLQEFYAGFTSDDLARMIVQPKEYTPAAIQAAEAELIARGELEEALAQAKKELDKAERTSKQKMTSEEIRRAINWGMYTAFGMGVLALFLTFIQLDRMHWTFTLEQLPVVALVVFEPLLRLGLGFGIYKRSYGAAVAFLIYMVVSIVALFFTASALPSFIGFVAVYGAYQGVQGTRAYRDQMAATELDEWFEVVN